MSHLVPRALMGRFMEWLGGLPEWRFRIVCVVAGVVAGLTMPVTYLLVERSI